MTFSVLDIRVEDIDHLGIVAGIIDEIGLVEQINQLLENSSARNDQSWASSHAP